MNFSAIHKPNFLNLDKNPKALNPDEAYFLLNHEVNSNGAKNSLGKSSPMSANYPACEMDQPAGENYAIGKHYAPITNENYSWVYNSNGVHYLQRINSNGECEIVYDGDCLKLSADPRHAIEDWRAQLRVEKVCPNRGGKYLIWVDGTQTPMGYLDVEASIATNSFRTPFFDRCGGMGCEVLQLCVPEICSCIQAEFIPLPLSEISLSNEIVDKGLQFMIRHNYYDGRRNEWSVRSTTYYQDSRSCFDSTAGFPRCLKLRIPAGNPMVDTIDIAFTEDGKTWYLYDTVQKYKKYNDTQQKWYERDLAELTNYSDDDCAFDYIFCNDKQKLAIDPVEISRVRNPIPRAAQVLVNIPSKSIIGDAIGVINYEDGVCPVDKFQVDKFNIDVNCDGTSCDTNFATIKVRAVVHNYIFDDGRNEFIYRLGGEPGDADDLTEVAFFGGLNEGLGGGLETGFDQRFTDKTRNFIAYIDGTPFYAVMKQWKAQPFFTGFEEWGTIPNMDDVNTRNRWRRAIRNGEFFYQEATIKVPKGTKGFIRLASHHATGNEQNTSTFVNGTVNLLKYKGTANLDDTTEYEVVPGEFEIYVDTCTGDQDITRAFIIDDNAVSGIYAAYSGYIKDVFSIPQEGLVIGDTITDHNGFYHFKLPSESFDLQILGELNCGSGFQSIKTESFAGQNGTSTPHDISIDNPLNKTNFYAQIKVSVVDCDGLGVGGIRISLSGSKSRTTDGTGVATFRIRNYSTRDRVVRAILLNENDCISVDCSNGCDPCFSSPPSGTPACYDGNPVVTLSSITINKASILANRNGLKPGGRYPMGIVVEGDCGRLSAVYEIKYIDIPKTQEKNKQNFCSLSYNGNGITLPDWATCLKIVRGKNVTPFELQWIVDKIEKTNEGKIKLTIQSLNDYNELYNFKTNTIYQWLKNDRIEFIRNGDGSILSTAQYGLLNYLTISPFYDTVIGGEGQPADFFNQLLIEDDGRLNDITEGAIIEIQRPKVSTDTVIYSEICVSIPIGTDGKLVVDSGVFNTFDTYFVNRTIGNNPSQRFEHHSPSDFWGDRMTDTGKSHIVNQYETERRYGRNMSVNSAIIPNYFGDIIKKFSAPEQGDITAATINDGKIGIAIGENDNFLFQVSDDLVRVGTNGVIVAASPDSVVSDPEPKLSGKYGCQYPDIGSVYFGDGWVTYVDGNKHVYVVHDYQSAKVAGEGMGEDGKVVSQCNTYFRKRIQEKETFNRSSNDFLNHYRFATGYNEQTGAVLLTLKALRHSGVNNEPAPYLKQNETILYSPKSGRFLTFIGGTPEGYSKINLFNGTGCAYLSYLQGVPYIHPIVSDRHLEFYGVGVDWMIGISLNRDAGKIKRPLAIEVQSEMMWYVKEVSTEMANFRSEIPPIRWKKVEDKYNAAFLANINSRGGLYGSEGARGYFVKVLFCRDNTDGLKYGTIDNNKRAIFSDLDNILFKFMISESSGMTENL